MAIMRLNQCVQAALLLAFWLGFWAKNWYDDKVESRKRKVERKNLKVEANFS